VIVANAAFSFFCPSEHVSFIIKLFNMLRLYIAFFFTTRFAAYVLPPFVKLLSRNSNTNPNQNYNHTLVIMSNKYYSVPNISLIWKGKKKVSKALFSEKIVVS